MFSCCFFTKERCVACFFFFFQAEDGIRDIGVTGVQTCALPISGLSLSVFLSCCARAPHTLATIRATEMKSLSSNGVAYDCAREPMQYRITVVIRALTVPQG